MPHDPDAAQEEKPVKRGEKESSEDEAGRYVSGRVSSARSLFRVDGWVGCILHRWEADNSGCNLTSRISHLNARSLTLSLSLSSVVRGS